MIPKFANKEDFGLFVKNELNGDKSKLYAMKMAAYKEADSVLCAGNPAIVIRLDADKAGILEKEAATANEKELIVRAVINTTNLLDSHGDVHIPGLWTKSISENKRFLHLQEHNMKFSHLISQEGKMFARKVDWKSLGYNYEGKTQALMFDSNLTTSRNEFMKSLYRSGDVKNHSVGMRYVKIFLCYNSDDKGWQDEKDNWDKYIDQVANRDEAEAQGMFWAVTEAKVIEGSAVVMGSNQATPTISVREKENEGAVDNNTPTETEPSADTQALAADKANPALDYMQEILSINKQKQN